MNRLENIMGMLANQPYPFVIDTKMPDKNTTQRDGWGFPRGVPDIIPGRNIVAFFDWKFEMIWMNADYSDTQLSFAYERLMFQKKRHDDIMEVPDNGILIITKADLPLPKPLRPLVPGCEF